MSDAGHQSPSRTALMYALLAGAGALAGHWISPGRGALVGAAAATGWEAAWFLRRYQARQDAYARALAHARQLGLPLVVIGAPDRGSRNDMCGDLVIDIAPSNACPNFIQADISRSIPLPNDSAVVFIPYVLEYVGDLDAAVRELNRVAPGRVYMLRVEPWTLTAYYYQGAKRTVPADLFPDPQIPALPAARADTRIVAR